MTQVLTLSQSTVAQLLPVRDCVDLVESVFAAEARGEARNYPSFVAPVGEGAPDRFSFKAGLLGTQRIFGVKAAAGADAPGMQELEPGLLSAARAVVDNLEQCRRIGEINVPVSQGLYVPAQEHATIGEVAAGLKPGRQNPGEITVFDSTGIGLHDVVVAEAVYRRALAAGLGERVDI